MMKRLSYLVFIIPIMLQNCENVSCDELAEQYRSVSINIKLEKISAGLGRNYTLEGKDKNDKYQKWQDFSSWILDIHQKIGIGDSIIKPLGKTYIIIKKQNDTMTQTFYLECQGKEYRN